MGFTMDDTKTPIPPNAGSGIQSFIRVNKNKIQKNHRIFQI